MWGDGSGRLAESVRRREWKRLTIQFNESSRHGQNNRDLA